MPKALITGGSRGIGAQVAVMLAAHGCDIVLCYREKHKRAALVAAEVEKLGRSCICIPGDLARQDDLRRVSKQIADHSPFSAVVLGASGGLGIGKDLPYAMAINCYAPVALATAILPLCKPDANVIYVTSHGAHFYYHQPVLPVYAHVALSKQSGEQCLRRMIELFARYRARLHIISGDVIEGTTTASLIDRAAPGFLRRRKEQVGTLPTIEEFSQAIAMKALSTRHGDSDPLASWCGSIEPYLLGPAMQGASDASD